MTAVEQTTLPKTTVKVELLEINPGGYLWIEGPIRILGTYKCEGKRTDVKGIKVKYYRRKS